MRRISTEERNVIKKLSVCKLKLFAIFSIVFALGGDNYGRPETYTFPKHAHLIAYQILFLFIVDNDVV